MDKVQEKKLAINSIATSMIAYKANELVKTIHPHTEHEDKVKQIITGVIEHLGDLFRLLDDSVLNEIGKDYEVTSDESLNIFTLTTLGNSWRLIIGDTVIVTDLSE